MVSSRLSVMNMDFFFLFPHFMSPRNCWKRLDVKGYFYCEVNLFHGFLMSVFVHVCNYMSSLYNGPVHILSPQPITTQCQISSHLPIYSINTYFGASTLDSF